jgi:hypothetical protein
MHCSDVNHRSIEGMDGGHGGVVQISMCMSPVVAVLLRHQWLCCLQLLWYAGRGCVDSNMICHAL